jgi:hypothetical protein
MSALNITHQPDHGQALAVIQAMAMELTMPEFTRALLQQPQAACPVVHRFGPGVYIRELTVKAGVFLVGHYQRFDHTNIFLKGRVKMFDPETGISTELVAPMIFTGKPGRKMGLILEDMVWMNVYATDETDVETLEAMFLDTSEVGLDMDAVRMAADGSRDGDRADFEKMKSEGCGLKAEGEADAAREIAGFETRPTMEDIPMPFGSYKAVIKPSAIHGRGVFATADIAAGEIIGPVSVSGKRTPFGRFVNHSICPNAEMVRMGDDLYLRAIRPIVGCLGGYAGEEITTDYRGNEAVMGRVGL